jgi:putative chitinase
MRAIEIVDKVAPNARPQYRQAFEQGDALLEEHGINTPLRLAHFLAQACHETGGLSILVESGNYKEKSLAAMWDGGNWHRYFKNRAECLKMADQCAIDRGIALFSLVYGNRMGNGPPASQDGWTYRGRGILQTTGRENYRKYGKKCSVGFEADPSLIIAPEHALKPALAEWTEGNLNVAADYNDLEVITRRINGGLIGLDQRKAWLARINRAMDGSAVELSVEWKVQEKLNARGYKSVKPDGVVGSKTRAAIIDYRARHGLPSGNGITHDLLQSLGIPD